MDKLELQHQLLLTPNSPEADIDRCRPRAVPVLAVEVFAEKVAGARMESAYGQALRPDAEALDDLRPNEVYT